MAKRTYKQIPDSVARREPFEGNSMRAQQYLIGHCYADTGRLNEREASLFEYDRKRITYVVFSYDTPIAWATLDGGKYKVQQKFTVTTSKHQGMLRGF